MSGPLSIGTAYANKTKAAEQGHESTTHCEGVAPTFWRHVVSGLSDECWLWSGSLDTHGYGCYGNPKQLAHRLVFAALVGPIPEGLTLDHLCRNRNCVNPGHLEPATRWENVRRGAGPSAVHARKTHCIHGHPFEGDNLHVTSRGWRVCRECSRRHKREARVRLSEALSSNAHESVVDPVQGLAEPLVRCAMCQGQYAPRRGRCPWCVTREGGLPA